MRTDKAFVLFLEIVKCDCDRLNTDQPTLARKRKTPKRFEVGEGDGYHSPTVQDYFRMIYYEALDLTVSSIQERFNQPGYAIYSNLESLLLKAAKQEDYSCELKEVLSFYKGDFNDKDLATQLEVFSTNYSSKDSICKKTVTLQDVLSFLRTLSDSQRSFLKEVCAITWLILVMPATNATSERAFSTMRRLKTYL